MSGIVIKNKIAREKMKTAGALLAAIMQEAGSLVREGVSTFEIDASLEKELHKAGLKPTCKGYAGYRHATCISPNDVIVHGIPSKEVILKNGDFVKIDIVASYKEYCADMARFYFVGDVAPVVRRLANVAQTALDEGIKIIRPGIRVSDISVTIQKIVEQEGFGVVRKFSGHGIGKNLHELPDVPNFGKKGEGPILRAGMALAIEPMITQGSYEVKIMPDGWTAKTIDGGFAAHVEDTVLVTEDGFDIVTRV